MAGELWHTHYCHWEVICDKGVVFGASKTGPKDQHEADQNRWEGGEVSILAEASTELKVDPVKAGTKVQKLQIPIIVNLIRKAS